MTINIPAKTVSTVLVYHHTQDGEKGYLIQVAGAAPQFITEADGDKLARYMLFKDTESENSTT